MTTISSSSVGGASQPFARVQNTLQRDVAAGTISSTDETAMVSALSDISAQLNGGATASAGGAGTKTATTSTTMKDRVDTAIDDEVSSGKLTSDQATALKGAFQQAHAHMHGAHGHHGGGDMLAALTGQPSSSDDQSATATSAGSVTNTLETAATSAVGALESFLAQFKAAVSSNGTYGANGAGGNAASSLLINSIG